MEPMTTEELVSVVTRLADIEDGTVFEDARTGFVGAARKPTDPTKCVRGVDGRPKIGLVGPSGKGDRENEMRLAFLDDLVPFDGDPIGVAGILARQGGEG